LPPTYIAIGSLDLFVNENLDFARPLIASGVAVGMELHASAPRGFNLIGDAKVSKRAQDDSLEAARRFLDGNAA
jgi:triacylglycerol lipase